MSRFRRVVLELGHGAADPGTLRDAAALARWLDAELHALFVEDEALLALTALPFAREISPLSFRWRPLDSGRLEADLRAAAERARRQLAETAAAHGIQPKFEIRRGDIAEHLQTACAATDIVVIAVRRRPEASLGGRRLREAARRSAASVLLLPPGPVPARGPIVALAEGDSDPALSVARSLAETAGERLIVLPPDSAASLETLAAALDAIGERLIVTGDAANAAWLATTRGVPVLAVEPGG
jgi:nucleotide-binding universal stress UspA family protein